MSNIQNLGNFPHTVGNLDDRPNLPGAQMKAAFEQDVMTLWAKLAECIPHINEILPASRLVDVVSQSSTDSGVPTAKAVYDAIADASLGGNAQQIIDDWLDAHPAATTTVQDGAVTNSKLATSFVTPGLASAYVSNTFYPAGSYVFKDGVMYTNVDDVDDAVWTSGNWTQVVLGSDVSNMRSAIAGLESFKKTVLNGDTYNIFDLSGLNARGYINGYTGAFAAGVSTTGLNCCTDFIAVDSTKPIYIESKESSFHFNIVEYDGDRNFLVANYREQNIMTFQLNNSTRFVRFSFDNTQANYSETEIYQPASVPSLLEQKTFWRNGSLGNPGSTIAIASRHIIPNAAATSFSIVANKALTSGYKYRFQISTYSVDNGLTSSNNGNRVTIDKTIVSTDKFATFSLADGSKGFGVSLYILDDSDNYVTMNTSTFDANVVSIIRHYEAKREQTDYAIDGCFVKRQVTLSLLGSLSGIQSFCKYDGKYYSYLNSNLYEQNENLEAVSTTPLNLGHGNALQLGHNGVAYASGWDDQKVYVVDLATKTISSTITLPTTGYTTCAVDDVNGLIYIFQRNSYPGTEEHYHFIVYDYVNERTVSSKLTNIAFGAMQACDFVNGRIFVVNGDGTSSLPNGYRIYNTNGDVIGEYVLNTIATEPEGVFVDRDTYDVYVSDVGGLVYKMI